MVTSVGGVRQLVSAIRGQLAQRAQQAQHAQHAQNTVPRAPGRGRAADAGAHSDALDRLIELRVRGIRRDDPQRGRKAFRVFLEVVLLSELGEGLLADPRFFQLLDDVQAALENNDGGRALVAQAIDQLLAAGDQHVG